jgi:hypothetical protein
MHVHTHAGSRLDLRPLSFPMPLARAPLLPDACTRASNCTQAIVTGGSSTTFKYQIYFCNIQMKHLQHTSKIDEHLGYTVETPLQHVQHTDLLSKHLDATLAIYKRK